jgi:hypothetical protein
MNDDFDNEGFDEFDEFRNFNREELNRLFRERMNDEDFRKRFMGIIGGYQRDYEGIMKLLWGMNNNPFNDPFSGLSSSLNPDRNSFLKGLDFTGFNEDGWNSEHWSSPDGRTHITSFSRSIGPEEYNNMNRGRRGYEEPSTEYVIGLLENKLEDAIENEDYEKAAELRDTIKSLKEGEKTKNEGKNEEK